MNLYRRIFRFFASMNFTLVILLAAFALVLVGTLMQIRFGIYQVQQNVFYAWYGGGLVLGLFILNLVCSLIRHVPEIRRPLGLILGHFGLVILLLGGFSDLFSRYFVLGVWEGQSADRIFHSDRWELFITDAQVGEEDAIEQVLAEFGLSGLGRIALQPGRLDPSGPAYDFRVEDAWGNAIPDPASPGTLVPEDWADSSSGNLPLLRLVGSLDGGREFPVEVWAGDAAGARIPVTRSGVLENIIIGLRPKEEALPFVIRLDSFRAEFYPDTDIPESFVSRVTIIDGENLLPRTIAMNRPLRYRGHVFYQNSYQFDQRGNAASVFSVQTSGGASLPYIGTAMSLIGFILHYLTRNPRRGSGRRSGKVLQSDANEAGGAAAPMAIIAAAMFMFMVFAWIHPTSLAAQDPGIAAPLPGEVLSEMAVQSAGRIMPAASFGELLLYELSGRRRIGGYDGERFLEDLLIYPIRVLSSPIIRVNHPDLFTVIGLEPRSPGRYPPADFLPALESIAILSRGISPGEDELGDEVILLYQRLETLFTLMGSFGYLDGDGDDAFYRGHPLRIIPGDGGLWYHPRDPARYDGGELQAVPPAASSASQLRRALDLQLNSVEYRSAALAVERAYRSFPPFLLAGWLFLVSSAVGMMARRAHPLKSRNPALSPHLVKAAAVAAGVLYAAALAAVAWGLISRVIITRRPPVTNLYSSILLAGFFLPLLGLLLGGRRSGRHWPMGLAAGFLFFLSPGFIPGGDDLAVVQAVLDNNFWLSVHVLVIIGGYALVFAASVIGHIHAVSLIRHPEGPASAPARYRSLLSALRLSLLFLFVGTMLGGFWADQSWGRFWGWDPKENAALLLIIWTSVLLHARPGGRVSEFGLAMGSAASLIVLMFSWFGVNLMGTGLHSYGWDPRAGGVLAATVIGELVFLIAALLLRRRTRRLPGTPSTPEGSVGQSASGESEASREWTQYRITDITRYGDDFIRVGIEAGGKPLRFEPGQAVTFRIAHRGQRLLRAYSLEYGPGSGFVIARREGGLAWEYFSQDARRGSTLSGGPPHGDFALADGGRHPGPELFAAAGAGLAPILSMVRRRCQVPGAKIEIHAALADWKTWPFYQQLDSLSAMSGSGLVVSLYGRRKPDAQTRRWLSERPWIRVHQDRLLAENLLERIAGAVVYLCGSERFVKAISDGLPTEGTGSPDLLVSESFSPAQRRSLRPELTSSALIKPRNTVVEIRPGQSLLEAFREAGLPLRGNCLVGRCGECRCNLISGAVLMDEPNMLGISRSEKGPVLCCCAYPDGDIEVEL
jgi:ferredoxin-NADP reductase/ABC-type transport system involved in cytochrome c biogenesis permease subunit